MINLFLIIINVYICFIILINMYISSLIKINTSSKIDKGDIVSINLNYILIWLIYMKPNL